MIFGSVCSGIEAASVAWHPLGWRSAFYAEIEPFPSAVLFHHYPRVPNLGDITKFKEWPDAAIDVLVGGTPCQSFSVAGLRKGLADPRGNLALVYLGILDRLRPTWMVWENVPGVLSSNDGKDFGAFLGGLGELGYGFAYRVLDAQYFGLAQRRKRVFVVRHLGDWRRAAAVLFERHSLSGNPPPRRGAREDVAPTLSARTKAGGELGTDFDCDGGLIASTGDVSHCLNAGGMGRIDFESETLVAQGVALRGREGGATAELTGDVMTALRTGGGGGDKPHILAFDCKASGRNGFGIGDIAPTLRAMAHKDSHSNAGGMLAAVTGWRVRRLTPMECERLQGFPDGYTAIPYRGKIAADGPRYKALGNSFAGPVVRWIGERIEAVNMMREAAA
jgi:DNA (cytosine-5)-methyltransferase 1